MNKFINAIKSLDVPKVQHLLATEPQWAQWAEEDGKNALHYAGALVIARRPDKADTILQIVKSLLKAGMDINSVHRIPDPSCGFFPATPLWYAYTRGRNEKLFTWLLKQGAGPEHCMYAIAWNNDVGSAALFKKHGATVEDRSTSQTPFMSAIFWKRFGVAEWFLKNGADVDHADADGNTALYYAVKRKYKLEQIEMLLKYGADPAKENNEGLSPEKLAVRNNQRKILGLFRKS